jgi:hypothetical protein
MPAFHDAPRATFRQCKCGRGPVRAPGQRYCPLCHAEAQKRYRARHVTLTREEFRELVKRRCSA